ncbi:MAG: 2-C-methyl-D-erythritol 2,4-cyclodiphosphate synthase [Thermoleophilia bacterium]|nr:2-C-methyl-D-erythritol 2,4-cyclodiphosphate synthase [Thermoleophilia bacterium]
MKIRTGIGIDAHRFAEGRQLVLGGVIIDHPEGLEGHSDADVLSHAIADALLGAAGLEDIGHYFPDSEPEYKGISSLELLKRVIEMVRRRGCEVGNIDAVLVLEAPRMAPYREQMRSTLAETLGIAAEDISLRATTTEGMGFAGRGEGIAACATCLVECAGSIMMETDI